ncbi:hypothetical protein Tco_0896259 [Tanacetum coccineum]
MESKNSLNWWSFNLMQICFKKFGGVLLLYFYYFSTVKALKTIINRLEGIRRKFFWGGSSDTYKIPWIAWNKVISSPKQGGLGIGSLVVSNQALLAKWWRRFLIEDNALWCKVIRSIHGPQGGLHDASLIRSKSGPWYQIAKLKEDLLNDYGRGTSRSFIGRSAIQGLLDVLKMVWELPDANFSTINELFSLADHTHLTPNQVGCFNAMIHTTLWFLWRARNDLVQIKT